LGISVAWHIVLFNALSCCVHHIYSVEVMNNLQHLITPDQRQLFRASKYVIWAIPLAWLVIGVAVIYTGDYFELDNDEGINLIKVFLVDQSYSLYRDIWNDQPPLMTLLLSAWLRVFGTDANAARVLALVFSSLLLGEIAFILSLLGGSFHGLLGALFLLVSPHYLRLSISVLIGLPALTLATGAIATLLLWQSRNRPLWLCLSAVLLAVSALFKLFTLFLAPIIVGGLLINAYAQRTHRRSRVSLVYPLLMWIGVFLGVLGFLLVVLVGISSLPLLLNSHLEARHISELAKFSFWSEVDKSYLFFAGALALGGFAIAVLQRRWSLGYFAAWLGVGLVSLIGHTPVWYHHFLILHIPIAILAAYGVAEVGIRSYSAWHRLTEPRGRRILLATGISICLLVGIIISDAILGTAKYIRKIQPQSRSTAGVEYRLLADLVNYPSKPSWLLTDRPMFAFRAELLVPPETAVLSTKKLVTGEMSEAKLIDIIQKYQPEQILLERFEWQTVTPFLSKDYRLAKEEQGYRLFQQ
jgi:hypothetical protein